MHSIYTDYFKNNKTWGLNQLRNEYSEVALTRIVWEFKNLSFECEY